MLYELEMFFFWNRCCKRKKSQKVAVKGQVDNYDDGFGYIVYAEEEEPPADPTSEELLGNLTERQD